MEKKRKISKNEICFLVAAAVIAIVGIVLWQISNIACAIVFLELPWLAGIFLAAMAIGYLPVKFLAPGLSVGQRLITAAACGVGLLSLIILGLGLLGLLHLRILLLGGIGVLGLIGIIICYRSFSRQSEDDIVYEAHRYWMILLAVLIPFLIFVLLCATIPPGVLWSAEGYGYDVLEYHLEVPKEWFQAGEIDHLKNNVYANFPLNGEMLYLLAMEIKNDPYEAVYLSQLIHVSLSILFVCAVWVFSREYGRKFAVFATISAGTCSWVAYLAPLAYSEAGMLFTGVVAFGLIFRIYSHRPESVLKYASLIGLLLGLCMGFKYTAVVMIAFPLVIMQFLLLIGRKKFLRACLGTLLTIVIASAFFSPYLIRNFFWTGNPVFPLCYGIFGGSDFDEHLAQRWKRGHQPTESERSLPARMEKLYWAGFRNIVADNFIAETYRSKGQFRDAENIVTPPPIMDLPKFGLAILLLPWIIFFTRRQRYIDWMMLLVFLIQTGIWLFATHLQGRFLITWLIVLPFLIGQTSTVGKSGMTIFITAVLLLATGINLSDSIRRYVRHCYVKGQPINWFGQHRAFLEGKVPGYEQLKIINKSPDKTTLLVGESRAFYYEGKVIYSTVFNKNGLAEAMSKNLRAAKKYIAQLKPDFIFVNWMEISRLSRTYGFDQSIRPNIFHYLSSPVQYKIKIHRTEKYLPAVTYMGREVYGREIYEVK